MRMIRPPAVAGSFYPRAASELSAMITDFLEHTKVAFSQKAKAYIVPHAGYQYSGAVAAEAYAHIAKYATHCKRVLLLGPCHRVWSQGLVIPGSQAFATPLGEIELDSEALIQIARFGQVQVSDRVHQNEHALEVQLPFLQTILTDFKLVPIAVGDASTDEVAQVLDLFWDAKDTLILVSSDLSHFHDYARAQSIDRHTTSIIEGLDYRHLDNEMACGSNAISGLLKVANGRAAKVATLKQCNSGDTAGDKQRVVGYATYAVY